MKRIVMALAAAGFLAACTNDTGIDSRPDAVAAVAFREAGPKTLTVFTMINNRTGNGGHTALMVKGSQTVIFDPAGSFRHAKIVERGDVIYGVTPSLLRSFKSAHARSTFHVVSQEITVSDEQAEQALRLVLSNGAVPGAFCANATTSILSKVDGFDGVQRTFYPKKFMEQFGQLPGVRTSKHFENDEGDIIDGVRAAELVALSQ